MNLFLPYGRDAKKNCEALDDKRLLKQIIECKTLVNIYLRKQAGEEKVGYMYHPVYVYHEQNHFIWYIAYYGLIACCEYNYRFGKYHADANWFAEVYNEIVPLYENEGLEDLLKTYVPFYAAGSKGTPECIRSTSGVEKLFQEKLTEKWEQDIFKGNPPKWTKRPKPEF